MSAFIQRQNIFVKLILYLLALFVIASFVIIILGVMFTETDEEIPNWIITISFIGSTLLSLALFLRCQLEHNALTAEFNARISSFPAKFFKGMWKLEEIPYFNVHDE